MRRFQSTRPHGARHVCRLELSGSKFQSTRPHGARRHARVDVWDSFVFQSTRPHGARLAGHLRTRICVMFQSTRPHGARRIERACRAPVAFQSTRPHGARRRRSDDSVGGFNPRARTGRDGLRSGIASHRTSVSIHAPARGATNVPLRSPLKKFQSTRPHGARLWRSYSWRRQVCFNPRARTGRDNSVASVNGAFVFQSTRPHGARPLYIGLRHRWYDVSIHAPAWGATIAMPCGELFQSTRPHGARRQIRTSQLAFQSTRPRGARRANPSAAARISSFNPRARTGRDAHPVDGVVSEVLFQSTRPHGARRAGCGGLVPVIEFQSTRPHGARPPSAMRIDQVLVSIHAPARGATAGRSMRALRSFNPRARTGRDLASAEPAVWIVSIHAPARGATRALPVGFDLELVSIHAPAWGATCEQFRHGANCFNPRARAGRDDDARRIWRVRSFNPRARMGRDAYAGTGHGCALWFQSTRPHGARRDLLSVLHSREVSIHAPAWGATSVHIEINRLHVSIHAPARGATRRDRPLATLIARSFNPRARAGRDATAARRRPRPCFNPRARMGRDKRELQRLLRLWVSIHAPAWGATKEC